MRRRGFSLIEVMIAVAIAALVVGLSLVNLRRPREGAESRSVAEAVAEELRLARLSAVARHIPVAVGFPSGGGASAVTAGLYVLEGDEKPRLTRSIRFDGDFPGAVIVQAFWSLQTGQMHDPGLGNSTADVLGGSSSDDLAVAAWAPAAYARDTLFVFTPSGAIRTNGAVHFDGSYHVLVSEGIELTAGAPPGGGTLAYAQPTRVCQPYTVNLSLSGQISVSSGVTAGAIPEATSRIATAPGPQPPPLAPGSNAGPAIAGVDVGPKNSDVLPGGVNVLVASDGHVTLRTRATDPDGDALFCQWQAAGDRGTFSSPTQDRMEWDPALGCWVSLWEWRPEATMAIDEEVELTCQVRDRSLTALAAVSSSAINVRIGQGGRVVYTSYNADYYADIAMVHLDGSGERLLTNTPEEDESSPSFSPDGQRIAYGVYDSTTDSMEMWVMSYDGTGAHALTSTPNVDEYPPFVWSPDGTHVACEGDDLTTGLSGIYVMAADGGSVVRLDLIDPVTGLPPVAPDGYPAYLYTPTWSRDGTALVCVSENGIYWLKADGTSSPVQLIAPPNANVYYDGATWSPTSNTLAYVESTLTDDEILLIDVDPATGAGTNQRHLFTPARTGTGEYYPSFNPTGTMLSYEDDVGVNVVPLTGAPITPLITSATAFSLGPAWTPQNNIVFLSDLGGKPDGGLDIYHANPSATFLKRLTSNKGDNEMTLQPAAVR